ncbi:MAG: toll/interleukin-1 receptor domain-containing protein, partial [Desulfobulbus sp.]|nr:toll/interleukin-1 receptor domain-containing protein [Desulfobulbus sp.]
MSTGYDIFTSYRRSDAGGHAGRLYDRLRHWFDESVIFFDLDAIDMGDVFPARIEAALDTAAAVLVVVGPEWLEELDRRTNGTEIDFVRREVELALDRHQCGNLPLLLPVLVGGSTMPAPVRLLPDIADLTPFCTLNAHTFHGTQADWDQQFVRLRERLARVPGMPEPCFHAPMGINQPFRITGHSLSPHFQDPQNLMGQLRSHLTASGGKALVARAALYGMGGVGKTQMALKYSLNYRDAYAGIWWFAAENETTLQLDAQVAWQKVSAPVQPGNTPTMALNCLLDRQQHHWLLVYDNAEDPVALRP